jgi:hypothetical protein
LHANVAAEIHAEAAAKLEEIERLLEKTNG